MTDSAEMAVSSYERAFSLLGTSEVHSLLVDEPFGLK